MAHFVLGFWAVFDPLTLFGAYVAKNTYISLDFEDLLVLYRWCIFGREH